ncbi:MAG: site-2 protease family protein [Planctomycetaceae bacterium]
MYATDTILTFGFPLGHIRGARFRVSFLFPVTALALIWRLNSAELGLLVTGLLFASVFLHELAHLLVARSVGDDMDELHLWPLGGLSEPFGHGYFRDHAQTLFAGPLMNLIVALGCSLVMSQEQLLSLVNPLTGLLAAADGPLWLFVLKATFLVNVMLLLVNLLPMSPFDGGLLLRTYASTRFPEAEARDLMVRVSLAMGIVGMLAGFVFQNSTVVAVSGFIVVLQVHESLRWYETIQDDVSGYDFFRLDAAGEFPGSLLGGHDSDEAQDAVLDSWRQNREAQRLEREQEERQNEEARVDDILRKLHEQGRESLNTAEVFLLNQVSHRYRTKRQHS